MVGIYAKIKNGLNWIKGKAAKYIAPAIGTLGDLANSEFIQGLSQTVTPFVDMAIPGLGSAINKGIGWMGKAGDIANGLAADYNELGDNFGFSDMITNVATGKYTKNRGGKKVPDGIKFAKRPDELHSRIQLKALPSGYERTGSYVEELD